MATDKEIADNIINCLLVLNKSLRDASKAGLQVDICGLYSTEDPNITATIFRRQDTVVAESPKRKK
jgi:hypothetical protein